MERIFSSELIVYGCKPCAWSVNISFLVLYNYNNSGIAEGRYKHGKYVCYVCPLKKIANWKSEFSNLLFKNRWSLRRKFSDISQWYLFTIVLLWPHSLKISISLLELVQIREFHRENKSTSTILPPTCLLFTLEKFIRATVLIPQNEFSRIVNSPVICP